MRNNLIRELRSLAPNRALDLTEALRVAELQAEALLKMSDVAMPPFPDRVITSLPRIRVVRTDLATIASAARWSHGAWMILLNWKDIPARQRFSLVHQVKHIIDWPQRETLYPVAFGPAARKIAEQSADHFAGSVLMPESWLDRCMAMGLSTPNELSVQLGVSPAAIRVRLASVGNRAGQLTP